MTQRVKLPIIGSGQPQKNFTLNPQHLTNWYEIQSAQGYFAKDNAEDKVPLSISTTPGTTFYANTPNKGEIRGQCVINQTDYIVSGSILYVMGITKNFLQLGVLSSSTGLVGMITNGLQIMIVDGYFGYTYTLSTGVFAKITDPNFPVPAPSTVTYQSGRAIVYQPQSTTWWVSNINDFTTYNALAFANANNDAQNSAQNIVDIESTPNDLFIFKTWSTEVWYLVSDPIFPYNLRPGIIMDQGCVSANTICRADSTVIWLAQNEQGQALLVTSYYYRPVLILDEAAQYQFSQLKSLTDAYATVIQYDGHTFYVITFPTDNKTFAIDIKTHKCITLSSWYQSGVDGQGNPNYIQGRHLWRTHQNFNGQSIIGDYRSGTLLVWDPNSYSDFACGADNSIYREVVSSIVSDDKKRVFISSMEVDCETGDSPLNPTVPATFSVSISRDSARRFEQPRSVSFGLSGQYKKRVKLNAWGYVQDGAVKISCNHNGKVAINSLIADLTTGQV